MAKNLVSTHVESHKTKRPGVHSKNASFGKRAHKKPYRGQGR